MGSLRQENAYLYPLQDSPTCKLRLKYVLFARKLAIHYALFCGEFRLDVTTCLPFFSLPLC